MHTLSIHIKTKASGLISEPCILLSYHNSENWSSLQRMLDHRGVEKQFLLKRNATDGEEKSENNPFRVGFLVYKSWQKLINDEMKFTDDKEYLNQLSELREKYREFEVEQIKMFQEPSIAE